ncbi:MAG: hypothetical protein ACRC8S_05220 [Fimbriiglobus sp.]
MKYLILSVLFLASLGLSLPLMKTAAEDKPAAEKPVAEKLVPGTDLSKKFVVLSRKLGQDFQSDLLKKIELRKLGNREFLVGEYVVNVDEGVTKEWEGVQLWVPLESVESLMVFGTEAKAWEVVKSHGRERK